MVKNIAKAREINKAHTTFIDTILKHQYRGRIHADINPVRSDQGGTVTGRFSYSNPNLQQIPARNKDLGPMIRSLFIPEKITSGVVLIIANKSQDLLCTTQQQQSQFVLIILLQVL